MKAGAWRRAPERYANVHGTPVDWPLLRVIDEETGDMVDDVVEVNCDAGWLRRKVRTACGDYFEMEGVNGDRAAKTERIEGKFRLEREVK